VDVEAASVRNKSADVGNISGTLLLVFLLRRKRTMHKTAMLINNTTAPTAMPTIVVNPNAVLELDPGRLVKRAFVGECVDDVVVKAREELASVVVVRAVATTLVAVDAAVVTSAVVVVHAVVPVVLDETIVVVVVIVVEDVGIVTHKTNDTAV